MAETNPEKIRVNRQGKMKDHEWLTIKEVFLLAVDRPDAEREELLSNQSELIRSEVRRLLDSHEKLDDFIAEPLGPARDSEKNRHIGASIGGYEIVSLLGAGGMGQVFLARRQGIERNFALKLIKRGMDTDLILARFGREREILSRLEHPFIANLIDAGTTDDGAPFFVLEYVEGVPVTDFCEHHCLEADERLEVFLKICDAVKYAHQNLVVHRDLKPSNILVTSDGTPKLLDFGIAKLLSSDRSGTETAFNARIFTPEYASPEQVAGKRITTASDVFSLGIVLYELLTGKRPFGSPGQVPNEVLEEILTKDPPRPSSVVSVGFGNGARATGGAGTVRDTGPVGVRNRRSLRGDLENIVLKALRKEPDRRYQSVTEFVGDIVRFRSGLPVTATADSAFYHFKKFVGRNRLGTAVAAGFVLLSVFAGSQAIIANQERARADERFRQVRKLANSVLFEYQDGIVKLAGSTAIREKMVSDGAEYLDRLAAEGDSDPELKMEIAKAFDRLGDLRGSFFTASIGNAGAAREAYLKALSIKEELLRQDPDNPMSLEQIAGSYDRLGDAEFGLGNQGKTIEFYQKAITIREQLVAVSDTPEVRFQLMRGYRNVAVRGRNGRNTDEGLAMCEKALSMSETLLSEDPENADYQEGYGDVFEGIAAILQSDPKRKPEAVESYRKLIGMRRDHVARNPNNRPLKQKHGMAHSYLGDTFFELGNLPGAVESYEKSLEILDKLEIEDPLDDVLRQDKANIRSSLAYCLASIGKTVEPLAALESVIPIFESKYAADRSDRTTHFRIAMAREGIAITYRNMADEKRRPLSERISAIKKSIENFETSLAIYREYTDRATAFPAINIDVGDAIDDVTRALEDCGKTLESLSAGRQ